jgi:peptidoglycan/xylan/chitin deacetylase (PgdA/CDA1 family)
VDARGQPAALPAAGSRRAAAGRLSPLVALTFDDGPGDWTPAILDLLAEHGARATFFVLGASIAGREEVLARTAAEGHELGNHGWTHTNPERLSEDELRAELVRTGRRIEEVAGVTPRLARPPYGKGEERFERVAAEAGFAPTVYWTIDPEDWDAPPAETIVRSVLDELHPGAIVDLHDGFREGTGSTRDRDPTVAALGELLPALAERGYGCVTVSELLSRPGARLPAVPPRRRSDS